MGQAQRKEKAGEAKLTISIKLLRVVTPNIRTRFNHYIVYMGGEGAKTELPFGSAHDVETYLQGVNAAMLALTGEQIIFPKIPTTPTHEV